MAKFSSVVAGTRKRKSVKLPLPGAHVDAETGAWVGPVADVDVRALREDEHDDVLAGALAFAKKKGVEKPDDDDPIYERGKMLHTLAAACVDPESPEEGPQPFFDGGVEQIAGSEVMLPEVVAYLYLQQQLHQDETNPLFKSMSPVEYFAALQRTAQGDAGFFVNSRPGMLWSFVRITASRLVDSLAASSPSSTSSGAPPETGAGSASS